ncbi:MAG: hypothetical protein KDA99_27650, partial [Planctomycetales bacterium]|nr:hypothetical protein [Planctomycetales bacterium]
GASSTTIDAGTTYLLVANLVNRESELENAGHNRLWINPNLSSLGTPDATSDGTGFGSGSVYSAVGSFFYSAEENATFKLDEVRWGDSMDDVLPIDDDGGNGTGGGIDPDFNNDGFVDGIDVDSLVAIIVSGANSSAFDMNQDTVVDIADLDTWRVRAGAVNLGAGIEYLRGDANLDGAVDVRDFNAWNRHRDGGLGWTQGDFNASGVVDNADFLIWNGNKFGLASSTSLAVSVPEPTTGMLLLMTLLMCLRGARGFRLDRDLPVG